MEKSIIYLYSYHHLNTRKIGEAIAEEINASIIDIVDNDLSAEPEFGDVTGFGSGIDSGKHYPQLISFVKKFSNVKNKKAFIFSTCGVYTHKRMLKNHEHLKKLLQNKGFDIIGEYSCNGYNTNSILKLFGGMNKDSPTRIDIIEAKIFAKKIMQQ